MNESQIAIAAVCDEIKQMLLEKNMKYGDAALNPLQIFSTASPEERLKARMDEKLSRIRNQNQNPNGPQDDEDARKDLVGCLILDLAREKLEANGNG
jgi:hypothetical protein